MLTFAYMIAVRKGFHEEMILFIHAGILCAEDPNVFLKCSVVLVISGDLWTSHLMLMCLYKANKVKK